MNPESFMWHRRGPSLAAVVGASKKVPMSIMMPGRWDICIYDCAVGSESAKVVRRVCNERMAAWYEEIQAINFPTEYVRTLGMASTLGYFFLALALSTYHVTHGLAWIKWNNTWTSKLSEQRLAKIALGLRHTFDVFRCWVASNSAAKAGKTNGHGGEEIQRACFWLMG